MTMSRRKVLTGIAALPLIGFAGAPEAEVVDPSNAVYGTGTLWWNTERRVFHVDVGNLTPKHAKAYLENTR